MRSSAVVVLSMSLAAPAGAGDAAVGPTGAEACRDRLAASLEIMRGQPLMKEEVATGLMWTRLDAAGALEAGDVRTCHAKMEIVDAILAPVMDGATDD